MLFMWLIYAAKAAAGFVSGNSGKQSLLSDVWIPYVVLLYAGDVGSIYTGAGLHLPVSLPQAVICIFATSGSWEVSVLMEVESYREERWARGAGKGRQQIDFVISTAKTCYCGMTLITGIWRVNG